MSWNNNPKNRALEPYAKRHGYATIVLMAVHDDAKAYEITTYGRTRELCRAAAAVAGDQLNGLVQDGTWPDWPDEMPRSTLIEKADAYRRIAETMGFIDPDGDDDPQEVVGAVADLMRENKTLSGAVAGEAICAACGEGFVDRDADDLAEKMTAHIVQCAKHPMHKALAENMVMAAILDRLIAWDQQPVAPREATTPADIPLGLAALRTALHELRPIIRDAKALRQAP